jgi:uroporphyrinogen decarboxylase
MTAPLLVRAARREQTERTPVWFMRQAGRSLPEYREIRKQHTLFEVCEQPELCAEVTLQPVRRHDVDAAVMFADIMLPVLSMGVEVELVENVGPVVREPIRSSAGSCGPTKRSSASAAARSPSPATSSRGSRAASSRP